MEPDSELKQRLVGSTVVCAPCELYAIDAIDATPGPGKAGHPPSAASLDRKAARKAALAFANGARASCRHRSAKPLSVNRHLLSMVLALVARHVHPFSPGNEPVLQRPAAGRDHHSPVSGLTSHCPAIGTPNPCAASWPTNLLFAPMHAEG